MKGRVGANARSIELGEFKEQRKNMCVWGIIKPKWGLPNDLVVKDLALSLLCFRSLLWLRLDSWSRKFCMPQVWPKTKKKKKKKKKKPMVNVPGQYRWMKRRQFLFNVH